MSIWCSGLLMGSPSLQCCSMDTFSPYSVEMLLCCSSAKSKSKKLTLGFFAYQDFTTCSLESRDITLCSSCVAVQGVKVMWVGEVLRILTRLWPEDSSTSVSIEWQNQRREGRPKARPPKQKATKRDQHTKQNKGHQPNQHKPTKKGGKGRVLKNLTRLWPGSSSTLTRNKRN